MSGPADDCQQVIDDSKIMVCAAFMSKIIVGPVRNATEFGTITLLALHADHS